MDLSNFDMGQIVMANSWVEAPAKWLVLWGVPGMQ